MRVLQTISNMLASWGGPCTCTCDLMDGLHQIGAKVDLLASDAVHADELVLGKGRPWMNLLPYDWKTPLALSANFKRFLQKTSYDIYHANTIWLYPSHITCKVARQRKCPYVLSPHGMLYPTALKVSAWKKWPIKKLWIDKDIHSAACLHATCEQEMKYIRDYGYRGPIAVIPNPVVIPDGVELKDEKTCLIDSRGRRQIGFLGRLHPIKKVENLLYAIDLLPVELKNKVSLQIMGKYDDAYEEWLKAEVQRLGISEMVDFVGFVSGKEKYERLAKLSALMVPSAQENFGMIVPEALICGTPVYASLGTPWSELNEVKCGWWKDNNPEIIADVIKEVLNSSDEELMAMGKRGRQLMEEKYEQHKVAQMMVDLYAWILEKAPKPDFVYEN